MLRFVVLLVSILVCQADELNQAEKLLNEVSTTGELVDLICSCQNEDDMLGDQRPADCYDILKLGGTASSFYVIYPTTTRTPVIVWCDMESDNGGWTVIQRRHDGLVDFDLGWEDYKHGFGFVGGEFWLGNENIHGITNQKEYELRIETKRYDGSFYVNYYNYFRIAGESKSYRLSTRTYTGHEDACSSPLGMESGAITDDQITASSEHSAPWAPSKGRLRSTSTSWHAKTANVDQWIQVDFGVPKLVTGVITQGRHSNINQWVTKYKVLYGDDGINWNVVQNAAQDDDMIFNGNTDRNTEVTNYFPAAVPVKAQYIRIQIAAWSSFICMRMELLGCDGDFLAYQTNQQFSTKDVDNDNEVEADCAAEKGAWWYGGCDESGLNGKYLDGATIVNKGIIGKDFQGEQWSLRSTEMKIRPAQHQADE